MLAQHALSSFPLVIEISLLDGGPLTIYNVILSIVIFFIYYKGRLTLKTIHLTNVCDI